MKRELMTKEDRIKVLHELQTLRSHVENIGVILEDVEDKAIGEYLTITWTDIQSAIEYLL